MMTELPVRRLVKVVPLILELENSCIGISPEEPEITPLSQVQSDHRAGCISKSKPPEMVAALIYSIAVELICQYMLK